MEKIEKILGRKINSELLKDISFDEKVILITGANGSIGKRLSERLENINTRIYTTDIETLDVTNISSVNEFIDINPDIVVNCAGAKHAPIGEDKTMETLRINTIGTRNLLTVFPAAKHILTSTCKSCNPETVYGASKLIAERMVMNTGGSVARFYNVVETSGNIFEIWDQQLQKTVVEECNRYFISLDEAVGLVMYAMKADKGRYSVETPLRNMKDVFKSIYGENTYISIRPRRGDRTTELQYSTSESTETIGNGIIKIKSWHD